jgi:ABC-2 type transport system permease protein
VRLFWPLRIAVAKLRPFTAANVVKLAISLLIFVLFLAGDFALFRRLFRAVAQVEAASPFFALGLLRNLLALVFLSAVVVLFSSAMTVAIGAFFNDLDLETYHAAPLGKTRVIVARWGKTFAQSATIVYVFILPMFAAFAQRYRTPPLMIASAMLNLALLLAIPVTLGSLAIVLLVRWFPIRRVHQIVATLAILVLTVAVLAFRMSRPERLFAAIDTDNLVRVLQSVELPSIDRYPGTALADVMIAYAGGGRPTLLPLKIVVPAIAFFAIFLAVSRAVYFAAFVRARESSAPAAIGAGALTSLADRLLKPLAAPTRALIGKEVRTLTRDVAQWSQLFLMLALLFLYLYNIRMMPLGGDVRAPLIAYLNVGMAGFVVAAICLRFAYPSISSEGRAFWLVQAAPTSYRRLLLVKVLVYGAPLTMVSLVLIAFANVLLHADRVVWLFTLAGASMLGVTLVALGVGLGAISPNFAAENPLQVGLSLGGFGYMGAALAYVTAIMMLMSRPLIAVIFRRVWGVETDSPIVGIAPIVTAVTLSLALTVFPLVVAEKRLTALGESR